LRSARNRNRITGGGVTSGLDFALRVIRELWGERSAPPDLVEHVRTILRPVSDRQAVAIELARERLLREAGHTRE
jgi:transcriptional regulator GlxA family with amidase domain